VSKYHNLRQRQRSGPIVEKMDTSQTPEFDATESAVLEKHDSLNISETSPATRDMITFRFVVDRYIDFRYKAASNDNKQCKLMSFDRPSSKMCMHSLVISCPPIAKPEAKPFPV